MAEEWKRANPRARNDRRARELMDLMQSGIFGIDSDPTACRIAAFSLYLAYLDQLSPRDIQALQAKGRVLPSLIADPAATCIKPQGGTIWCGDFFATDCSCPCDVDLVVGNPPWGSIAGEGTLAAIWLAQNGLSVPDGQIAAAFIWKAPRHISSNGRVCLVLPHGILFNHSDAALDFQRSFIQTHSVERVLNLTDFQSFLFSKARHPALVIAYRAQKPAPEHCITYWAPKADWKALKVEIITISENDRSRFPQRAVVDDLHSPDAPQIWKRMSWATPRDRRLLDRLSDYPRLRDRVRQAREADFDKTWLIAEGFQPLGPNDDPERAKVLSLPSDLFIPANSPHLDLFLLPEDCIRLDTPEVKVRARSNKRTEIFHSPHVIVAKGFGRIAFADFPVSFQHALRGITGPAADRDLLIFLTAYLQSAVAQYFQFHTSSNWGVSRNEVHVEELLRLPFPLPNGAEDSSGFRSSIVAKVVQIVELAAQQAANSVLGREEVKRQVHAHVEELMYDYFDVIPSEQILIRDTVEMLAGSFRPGTRRQVIPAIAPTTVDARRMYVERLCETLNGWSRHGAAQVRGASTVSEDMGLGLVTLEKAPAPASLPGSPADLDLLVVLDKVRDAAMMRTNSFELTRGIKVFDGPRLYIVKPLEYRFWSGTAALNDADDIAGSILLQSEARLH